MLLSGSEFTGAGRKGPKTMAECRREVTMNVRNEMATYETGPYEGAEDRKRGRQAIAAVGLALAVAIFALLFGPELALANPYFP